jgi:tRNA A37 threonylcarbamoyltransferase TsaD
MVEERGGQVGKMDERYCIDNGAMIAYAGFLFKKDCFNIKMVNIKLQLKKQLLLKDLELIKSKLLGEMIEEYKIFLV